MIEFSFAIDWVDKLAHLFRSESLVRKAQIGEVADELLVQPEELAPMFIEPDLQQHNPIDDYYDPDRLFRVPCFKYIEGFIRNSINHRDGRQFLFILGDAGMGKTSVLAMIKLAHANSFLPKNYDCVAIKLSSETLSRIQKIRKRNKTLLLLDALDEDENVYKDLSSYLEEILKETQNFLRVVITCRTQFFPRTQEREFLRQDQIRIGGFTCPLKYLSLFDSEKVDKYLSRKFSKTGDIQKAKSVLSKVHDLRFRPMLLAYIDDLIESNSTLENAYQIYSQLVHQWLSRETRKKGTQLNKLELLSVCHRLARYMIREGIREVSEEQLYEISLDKHELSSLDKLDVGGRSLLNRNSNGDFRFSHQSFPEFLVVQSLQENAGWDFANVSHLVLSFMKDCEWEDKDLSGADFSDMDLRGMKFIRCNLEGTDFSESDLSDTDFTESDLSVCKFHAANLENAKFLGAEMSQADLTDASILNADFSEARLKAVSFSGAELRLSKFEKANFERADLTGQDLQNISLASLDFSEAILFHSNLAGADLSGANFSQAKFRYTRFSSKTKIDGLNMHGAKILKIVNAPSGLINLAKDQGAEFEKDKSESRSQQG